MSEKDNGGAAFPSSGANFRDFGMSLRDYFAAKALTGILSNFEGVRAIYKEAEIRNEDESLAICKTAYQFADDMMEVRK